MLQHETDLSVLTSLGERMTTEDVDELLKGVDTKDGNVNYTGELAAHKGAEFSG